MSLIKMLDSALVNATSPKHWTMPEDCRQELARLLDAAGEEVPEDGRIASYRGIPIEIGEVGSNRSASLTEEAGVRYIP